MNAILCNLCERLILCLLVEPAWSVPAALGKGGEERNGRNSEVQIKTKGEHMAVQEDLTVAYHQQDTNYYCGAACAQMVLDSIGAGLLDQDDLYADNHSHSTIEAGWYTAPDGLQWTLNDRRPAGFGGWFALYALGSEDAISRKIVWTIHHYHVAPVPLVFGWAHWIVVRGFDASAAPANSADTSYSITAFDLNNPWPPTPSFYAPAMPPPPPPPPHGAADGCGTGGNRGIANEHITYATWQADYMTGVPAGHWNGKFVAVCDPDPPPTELGMQRPTQKRLRGDVLLTRKAALERASRGLEEYGLLKRKGWNSVLKGTTPGDPVLVQRLDRADTYYYIVPYETRQKTIAGAVSVDARFGDYRQAIALPEGGTGIMRTPSTEVVRELILGRRVQFEEPLGRIRIRKEAFCLYPTLVWKPCLESLSPFYPFHMFTIGSRRIYVRIDGQIFTALHDNVRGI